MNDSSVAARRAWPLGLLLWPLVVVWRHRILLWRMSWRDISGRYRESFLGSIWAVVNPLLMLSVYTFVFGFLLKSRWPTQGDSKLMFAITLFSGLIVHAIFAETANGTTSVIVENTNYVKKVVFPLEILPLTVLGSAAFHGGVSLLLLIVANAFLGTGPHWTVILLPLIVVPVLIGTAGVGWFLGALGVFVRDAKQLVGFIIALMLYLSPVFYPIGSFPAPFRWLLFLNPLTLPIEQVRAVVIEGVLPDWTSLAVAYLISLVVMSMGFAFFERARRGFADVI